MIWGIVYPFLQRTKDLTGHIASEKFYYKKAEKKRYTRILEGGWGEVFLIISQIYFPLLFHKHMRQSNSGVFFFLFCISNVF